jgi:hypothetical protein
VKLRTGPRKSSRQSSEIAVQIQTDWNVKYIDWLMSFMS